MKTFEELGVSPEIRRAIEEMGYEQPMPVQEAVIPYLLGENSDVVALAQTGTGKTAAYGLPLIQQVDVSRRVPQALVLSPTRELCLQIAGDLNDYSRYIDGLHVLPVYGGSSIDSQIRALKRGVHIIVATPGRLLDLMQRQTVSLANVRDVVLDEADEMLDMGFSESLDAILADVPQDRHTLLFSATMSPEIARIARNYLHDAHEITIGRKNEGTANVKHVAYVVHAKDKYETLKRIVDYNPSVYGIIFCRTRKETQEIADRLMQEGYNADALHGELSQPARDMVMQKFRLRALQLLVATDVAARGLDVDDLTHVINYGLPDDTEVYTHRSGRTGRAGKTGISVAIINLREKGRMRQIERIIGKKFEMGQMPTAQDICQRQLLKVIDDLEKVKVNEEEIAAFMPEICRKLDWLSKEDLIKRVVSHEFNRFSDYYRHRPDIHTDNGPEPRQKPTRKDRKTNTDPNGQRMPEEGYTRFFVSLGKNDGLTPNELIGLINAHVKGRAVIGRIDLMPRFSFFEATEEFTPAILKGLARAAWRGRPVSVEVATGDMGSTPPKAAHAKAKRGKNEQPQNGRGKKKHAADAANGQPDRKPKKDKPSREERGYTQARGRKDDWKQFFQHDDNDPRWKEPDFSEEGWAKPSKKK